jgi:hypothetical protein
LRTAHAIGWRPVDFWPSTLVEFFECIEGHNEAQGGEDNSAPSEGEMAKLMAKYT